MKKEVESRKTGFYRYMCLLPADLLFQNNHMHLCSIPEERGPFQMMTGKE